MRRRLRDLTPPAQVFRPVDPDGIDMTLLRDSIRKNGLLVPLTVCGDTIVNGYRRWLVCKGLGWDEIDVHEVEGNPDELRIITQTREVTFTRDDKRALVGDHIQRNRDATAGEIAHAFQWTISEVESLAGVEFLIPHYRKQYDAGQATLLDVWHLSRVRNPGQLLLLSEESEEPIGERAAALHREVRSARRRSMVGRPRGKGYNKLLKERDTPTEAGVELIRAKAKTAMDGWRACLDWVLDPGK